MDPIDREDFNPFLKREPNPERIKKIDYFARRKAHYDALLTMEVREAIATGHSYRQCADAAGVSVTVIQRMVNKEFDSDEIEGTN